MTIKQSKKLVLPRSQSNSKLFHHTFIGLGLGLGGLGAQLLLPSLIFDYSIFLHPQFHPFHAFVPPV